MCLPDCRIDRVKGGMLSSKNIEIGKVVPEFCEGVFIYGVAAKALVRL